MEKKLTEEEEIEKQKALREYMDEYNSTFRNKSLMEEHLERKREKKQKDKRSKREKINDAMSREFNRDKDL